MNDNPDNTRKPTMFRMINRRWNPWRELDEMVNAFTRAPRRRERPAGLNVREDKDGLVVVANVPGVAPEDIDVKVHGDQVSISAKAKPQDVEGMRCIRRERTAPGLERTFRMPYEVAAESVAAELKNGVLTVRLPRVPAEQPKQIEVHVA
jgi:HSP20 family protein